jgi:hypothetical protein
VLLGYPARATVGHALGTAVSGATVRACVTGTAISASVPGTTVSTAVSASVPGTAIGTTVVLPGYATLGTTVGQALRAAVGAAVVRTRHAVSTAVGCSFGLRHSAAPHRRVGGAPVVRPP